VPQLGGGRACYVPGVSSDRGLQLAAMKRTARTSNAFPWYMRHIAKATDWTVWCHGLATSC